MILKDLSSLERDQPSTYLGCLLDFEPPLQPLEFQFKNNTEPNKEKLYIPCELIGQWAQSREDPFPDYDGIMAYA
jgi:hypothetical protein